MNPTIVCPKCQKEISIDEAFSHKLSAKIREQIELEQEKKLEEEKRRLWKIAQEKAEEKIKEKSEEAQKLLQEELLKKDAEIKKMREEELKLRKEKQLIEEEKEKWNLEKERQLDEEREKIKQKTAEVLLEEHRMRDLEKNKQMEDMRRKIDELQMKVNLTSQQLQGEVQELDLENLLKTAFPYDEIVPVGKGVTGADIIQKVHDSAGRLCGSIVWESKRTKTWGNDWIQKLKDDRAKVKGDVAILVSSVLPDGIKIFGNKDGVIVTGYECLESLAYMVRVKIIDEYSTKQSVIGKNEKMEVVYNYLIGNEFKQKFEAIVMAFTSMKDDIEKEKRVYMKVWEKREKQLERVLVNTVGIHGDLQGLVGASLPEIKELELTALLEDGSEQELLFEDVKQIES